MPAVSIIVPAFNEEKLLPSSLRAINAATGEFHTRGFTTGVIVCDNNSTDRTAEVARANGATVVFEPVNQIARARNAGAAVAKGEWLIFIDADSEPSKALFAETASALRDERLIAGGTTIAVDCGTSLYRIGARVWNRLSRIMRWAAGSYVFCRTDAFNAVGRFNEKIYASEEIDLFMKLKRHARASAGRIRILREPLKTSDRKLKLYSTAELMRFGLRAVFRMNSTLTSREACAIWYDGRR